MTHSSTPTRPASSNTLRTGILTLAAAGTLGAGYELAVERHWGDVIKLVPWVAVTLLAVAIALATQQSPRLVLAARLLAVLVLGMALFGIAEHILQNMHSGHLDQAYGPPFKQLPALERLWLGMTKTVGKAPPLAPGALGQSALLVLLGTLGHNVRER